MNRIIVKIIKLNIDKRYYIILINIGNDCTTKDFAENTLWFVFKIKNLHAGLH